MQILDVRKVKNTRKPWKCSGCQRDFPKGTAKERQTGIHCGQFYCIQWCNTCVGISQLLFNLDSEYRYEGVTSDDILEYKADNFISWAEADFHFFDSNHGIING